MNSKIMVVMSVLSTMLCLASFTSSYPQRDFPTATIQNEPSPKENYCIVEENDGKIHLYFNLGKTLDRGGVLELKEVGDDFGMVISAANNVSSAEGVYLVKRLYTTGENGFEFFHYKLVTSPDVLKTKN